MQYTIFHSIAESKIFELISLLNDGRNENEQFKLYDLFSLNSDQLLLVVYNEKTSDFLFNIVNEEGNIPSGNSVNFRNIEIICTEFKKFIPEIVLRFRIAIINKNLTEKGYDANQIEQFWNNIFKKKI